MFLEDPTLLYLVIPVYHRYRDLICSKIYYVFIDEQLHIDCDYIIVCRLWNL